LTADEVKILKSTSLINNKRFLPFLDEFDVNEQFSLAKPFVDPEGMSSQPLMGAFCGWIAGATSCHLRLLYVLGAGPLQLSPKQEQNFGGWRRAKDLHPSPRMIDVISAFSVKQTIITDCSFVAAMAVTAHYERRFKKVRSTAPLVVLACERDDNGSV